MLEGSIIGKLYGYWTESRILAVLYAIFSPFSRAFKSSAVIVRLTRPSRLEDAYRNSMLTRLFHLIINALLYLPRRVYARLEPALKSSFFVRICSGSAVFNFEFLLGAFIFIMFAAPHAYWSNTYALLATVALFALYLLMAAVGKRETLYPEALGLPLFLFALACVLSMLFTRSRGDSFRVLLFFVSSFLLVYIIVADITTEERLMKLMGFIYAAVMLTALYAVYQRIVGVQVDMLLTDVENNVGVPGRVFSTLDNPNNYAEFLVIFTPLCTAYAMNVKNNVLRLGFSCALALPMLALVMTYSRSGWISIVLAAIVFVYFAERKLVPLFFLVCLLAVPFLPDSIVIRVMSIFRGNDTSAAHRVYVWRGILLLLQDDLNWLTGIGLGPETFEAVYFPYARKWATEGVFHSQMQYLEIIMEIGIVGFVSFMWMMLRSVKDGAVALYRTGSKKYKYTLAACCASFVGLAAASAVEYIWYYPRVMFATFILLGICMAVTRNVLGSKEQA